jgi:hypothetical protein
MTRETAHQRRLAMRCGCSFFLDNAAGEVKGFSVGSSLFFCLAIRISPSRPVRRVRAKTSSAVVSVVKL